MRKYKTLLALVSATLLSACASHPDKITAASVSPVAYQGYSCKQISQEVARINKDVTLLYGQLQQTANNDGAQMAIGMVLFWPALFFLEGGDGVQAAEYAQLKGELDALESVSIQRDCDIAFPEEL
ncbi:MAG: metal ABC transporter ATP-binding protein [Pseudomonadota bacterium]